MSSLCLVALDRPEIAPLTISTRLRSQLVYFTTPTGSPGVPPLGEDEFWFAPEDVARSLDDGVVFLVSPLDTTNMTEVELSEEQETLLSWLQKNQVRHVRIEG